MHAKTGSWHSSECTILHHFQWPICGSYLDCQSITRFSYMEYYQFQMDASVFGIIENKNANNYYQNIIGWWFAVEVITLCEKGNSSVGVLNSI